MTPSEDIRLDEDAVVHGRVTIDGTANRALKMGRHRLVLAGALLSLAYLVIGVRLVDVTLVKDGFEPRFTPTATTSHPRFARSDIVDRNGVLLATNLPTASLYADPKRVMDARETADELAAVLPGVSHAELLSKLTSARRFVWLKRNLTPRQQVAINRLGLPGVGFQREERRTYPLGSLFAHVAGFADIDNRGIAGVEKSFDDVLRAPPRGPAEPLRLSLDARVQHALREELRAGMTEFSAIGAAGVVLDVNTGELLAMSSLPDFDPNHLGPGDGEARFNRATLGAYEMGSTFKVFNTAMALDSGIAGLADKYDASAPLRVARFVIRDYKPKNRWLTVSEIFAYSSNIGSAKMALDVGTEAQRDYLARFGLLRPADIELPEVAAPIVPSPWREINTMTIAFGHGVAVSPLQLSSAVASVVNGGVYHPATLIKRTGGAPLVGWRAISPDTSLKMRALLRLVVASGTGGKAAVPGYMVGGKTGTAEKPSANGYARKSLISSFVAAFPMSAPRYVVFVMFDEPQGTKATFNYATGGWTAAPAVGRIIRRIGPMLGVAPIDDAAPDGGQGLYIKVAGEGGLGVAF
jgi:cell division protein FtsI (penicillin-binding protein 3)